MSNYLKTKLFKVLRKIIYVVQTNLKYTWTGLLDLRDETYLTIKLQFHFRISCMSTMLTSCPYPLALLTPPTSPPTPSHIQNLFLFIILSLTHTQTHEREREREHTEFIQCCSYVHMFRNDYLGLETYRGLLSGKYRFSTQLN